MSTEQLRSDWQAIESKLNDFNGVLAVPSDIVGFLKNELGPFIGSLVNELSEVDEAVSDMYANAEDTLQPETAGVFAALITTGRELVATLAKAAKADTKNGAEIIGKCGAWMELSKAGEKLLSEITVEVDEDEDEDEDVDDDDDDADDADDDKETK